MSGQAEVGQSPPQPIPQTRAWAGRCLLHRISAGSLWRQRPFSCPAEQQMHLSGSGHLACLGSPGLLLAQRSLLLTWSLSWL